MLIFGHQLGVVFQIQGLYHTLGGAGKLPHGVGIVFHCRAFGEFVVNHSTDSSDLPSILPFGLLTAFPFCCAMTQI